MFYSQTFLARKGPLSTVWIAAHLQHRLKKSHYTSTHIPSTVQHIMDPGVPIALRMSGHLLLGVVRIYSKKVDYLFHDCNVVLTGLSKAFAAIQLTLPEDARQAPVQSITLPENFNLDALNLGDEIDHNWVEDMHRRSQEDITLEDRNPVIMDHYVAISFDEDMVMDSSRTEVLPDSGERPMEEDTVPQSPSMNVAGVQDRSPTIQINVGVQDRSPTMQVTSPAIQHPGGDDPQNFQDPEATCPVSPSGNSPTQATQAMPSEVLRDASGDPTQTTQTCPVSPSGNSPTQATQAMPIEVLRDASDDPTQTTQAMPIEVLRDANNGCNIENPPVYSNLGDNDTEPNNGLDQTRNEKDPIPEMIDDMGPGGISGPLPLHFGPSTPATSQGGTQDAHVFVEHNSPNLVLRSSPPIQPQQQQQQRRGRKRKQLFDEPIVLTNKFMRDALNNPRNILRKRRDLPSTSLGAWKLNNSQRKENMFDQPLITGLCQDLLDISKTDYIRSRPHLVISEEDNADNGCEVTRISPTNQIPEEPRAATPPATASDMEIEHPPTNQIPEELRAATPPVTASDMEIEHPPTNQIPEEPRAATPPVNALDMEIEQLRSIAATPSRTIPAHNVDIELNIEGDHRSPVGRDDMTPVSAHKLRSVSVSPLRTNIASESVQTPDIATSLGAHGSEMETPMPRLDDTFQNFSLSDTHRLISSAESEDLSFLEMDNNTPASSQGTSKTTGSLSVRTRAVAQYLKAHSPISPILEDPAEDLSLNKILEGKSRKISARMFYEVLVLKTHGLIDVRQEEPYDDISLKLMPTLSNAKL